MPRALLHALFAAVLLAAGAATTAAILLDRPPAAELELPAPRPVPVDTVVLEPRSVPRTVRLVATLRAVREVTLSSESGGRIDAVFEDLAPGVVVEAGEVLLSVDSKVLERELAAQRTATDLARTRGGAARTEVERAEAALRLARESLALLRVEEERWRGLTERGRAEQARLDLARRQTLAAALTEEEAAARLDSARSAVEVAGLEARLGEERAAVLEERLRRADVRAPFTGRFVPLTAGGDVPRPGRVLAPSEPVGSLVDLSRLRLVAEVHEDDVVALGLGSPAVARPMSRPGLELTGEVTAIGASVDPLTRAVVVEAAFADPRGLPAGSSARVVVDGAPLADAIWLPESAIGFRSGRAVAFVVGPRRDDGAATCEARTLELAPGQFEGGRVVRTGLGPGDEVVVTSVELVGDGAAVRPREAARRASSGAGRGTPR